MKKIIFCDIDGTIKKGLHGISTKNLLAFKKFMDAGGKLVLSTGRSISSVRGIVKTIEKYTKHKLQYIVCSTGGYIYDAFSQTTITHPISNFNSRKIYQQCVNKRVWFWGYNEEANKANAVYASGVLFRSITKLFKNLNTLKIKDETDLTCFKIIVLSYHRKRLLNFTNWIETEFKNEINVTRQNPMMLELNTTGVNKGKAIKYILTQLNISPGDAVAIGNGMNDIEAFSAVGLSFAVNTKKKEVYSRTNFHYTYFKNVIYDLINEHILDLEKE